jgi:selenide,water dikinase
VQVLSTLPKQTDPRLLVSNSGFDDAGVAALSDDVALVQTVDFFPPVVDDPWWFGRIAAANALSDLYAMGADPFSALNIVVFPVEKLPLEVLSTILKGGADALNEAGVMMLGGHSVADEGVKYGVAVTGTVKPGEQVTNAGAEVGDRLYLTKALGTGCLTTAAKKGKLDAELLETAQEQMGALNRAAGEAMRAVGVHACTDVTGYGLIGHAHELAAASDVALTLSSSAMPLLPGARDMMKRGFASGGAARTLAHVGAALAVDDDVDDVDRKLAADSETSGGLLIAVAPDRAEALEAALRERDVLVAAVGEVTAAQDGVRIHLTR